MNKRYRWSNLVIGVGLVLVLFSAPHLIDDFLYGIPEEFGLTNQQTQVLAGIFHTQLIVFFVLAARERKAGYYGEKPESVQPLRGWQSLVVGMMGNPADCRKAEGFLGRQLSRAFPLGIFPAQSAGKIHGLLFWGVFLALAGILKHLPKIVKPEPYWSGPFSETLIIGMIIVGIALAVVSILALRDSSRAEFEA